jgi:hypothetical protein
MDPDLTNDDTRRALMPSNTTTRTVSEALALRAKIDGRVEEIYTELQKLADAEAVTREQTLAKSPDGMSWKETRPMVERRDDLRRELESLSDDRLVIEEWLRMAEAEERLVQRAEVIAAADVVRERQRATLKKAGRLLSRLEAVYRNELVENAAELTRLRSGSNVLFDDISEFRATFAEPAAPFPMDFWSFTHRLTDVACSGLIRSAKLASEELLDCVPDLRPPADEKPIVFDGVESLPTPGF